MRSLSPHQRAIAIMVPAMFMLPGIDAIAKFLSDSVPAGQVSWARFAFQTLIMLPFVIRGHGFRLPRHFWLQALRGAAIAFTTLIFFAALRFLPLADAIGIFFVEPLLLTLLSALFLGEQIGWRRMIAVLAGLVGAMIVVRPSFATFGLAALLPLGAAMSFAMYLLLTRWLSQREESAHMQFYAGVSGWLVMSVALLVGSLLHIEVLDPVSPTLLQWGLLAVLGIIATFGHWLVVVAFRLAPAAVLAPLQYLEILGATLLGWLLFNDLPDMVSCIGIAIIVGSGLYVAHRENLLHARLTVSNLELKPADQRLKL
ncbi:MAG: S-adenosylmethionine uptake transporter [Gammaproteobacteria bacterium]|jgi:S-adenosylmethionine uptake transporter